MGRALRPHQVHRAVPQLGHQRQKQHQHAHAAHPLGQGAPQQNAAGQMLHLRKHRGAGGGQAGHRFKHRVHIVGQRAGERIGQRTGEGQGDPAQRHGHKAVAAVHLRLFYRHQMQRRAQQDAQHRRAEKRQPRLAVQHRRRQRQQQEAGLHPQHIAGGICDQSKVHSSTSVMPQALRQKQAPPVWPRSRRGCPLSCNRCCRAMYTGGLYIPQTVLSSARAAGAESGGAAKKYSPE